jgi:hypothetical protein
LPPTKGCRCTSSSAPRRWRAGPISPAPRDAAPENLITHMSFWARVSRREPLPVYGTRDVNLQCKIVNLPPQRVRSHWSPRLCGRRHAPDVYLRTAHRVHRIRFVLMTHTAKNPCSQILLAFSPAKCSPENARPRGERITTRPSLRIMTFSPSSGPQQTCSRW